jgi:hypothetical protein
MFYFPRRGHWKGKRWPQAVEGEDVTGDEVRQAYEKVLPQAEIDRLCEAFGVIARQRQPHLGMGVQTMVISAGTPGGADQADV